MSDQPLTAGFLTKALMDFHRDVLRPEFQRDLSATIEASERRLTALIEGLAGRIVNLETEYAAISAALERIETRQDIADDRMGVLEQRMEALDRRMGALDERLGRVEARLEDLASDAERVAMRAEVEKLRVRVEALHDEIRRLERRIGSSET